MSFVPNRDINNNLVKKLVNISTIPTIDQNKSIGSTGITDIATITTLNLGGTNVTASSSQLNYLNVTPGVASPNEALIVDNNRSITGINSLSSTNLVVNGTNITSSLFSTTSSDDLNSPYLTGMTAGNALALKALIPDSSININDINNISSKTITLNNSIVSIPLLSKKINLNSINNKRLIPSSIVSNSTLQSSSWNQMTTNNTAIDSNYWNSICYSPELGLFVSVASSGTDNRAMSSPDGIAWTIRTSAADNTWNSVCWGSSLFVAVASSGVGNRVMTSPDGINWTIRISPANNTWNSICYSPELNLFIAVASSGTGNRVMNSSNGIDWNLSKNVTDNNWQSVCWSPELNLFASISNNGTNRIMISSNGLNWTNISEPSGTSSSWNSICWSPELGLFLAVALNGTSNKNFMRSSDGMNWYSSSEVSGANSQVIAWSKDLEMFMGMDSNGQNFVYSYDGILWTKYQLTSSTWPALPAMIIWSIEYKMFIVVSNYNGLSNNTTGQRIWYTNPCTIGSKGGVLCNQSDIFINQSNNYVGINTNDPGKPLEINSVSGNCFKLMYSTDITKYYSFDVLNTGQFNINTLKYFNINTDYSLYGLLLNNTLLKTSVSEFNNYLLGNTNGVAQASKIASLDNSSNITGINFIGCNSLLVNGIDNNYTTNNEYFQNISSGNVVASKALIMNNINNIIGINNIGTSKLSINNSYINNVSSQSSNSINVNTLINKTKYLKADINRAINTWTLRVTSNNSYNSLCWSPELGIFVGVSNDGTNRIATSTNGIIWTDVVSTVGAAGTWNSICWSSELSLFVAIGSGSIYIMTSSDGTNWTVRISPENNTWRSVCWSSELSLFVGVGSTGTNRVIISNNGINWYLATAASVLVWTKVCWANTLGLFVATATDSSTSVVMTSPNGINWTTRTVPISQGISSITWSQDLNLLLTTCGNNSNSFYSYDGINWFNNSLPTLNWNTVSWISELGIFVMMTISTLGLIYSYDGFTWTTISISGNTNYYSSIIWSSELNMLVASSYSGTVGFKMYTSELFSPNSKSCIMSNELDLSVNNTNGRVGLGMVPTTFQLQLSSDSASKPSTSTWTVSSDSRLKENIQDADLDLCYDNIKNLRLAKYTWKDDVYTSEQVSDRSKLGWIAQEVETIFPKSVLQINAHGFSDCRTLNTDQIIASLYGFSQKLIKNYEDDDVLLNSMTEKVNEIKIFINNIPEE